jgi:hypothetical protein
MIRKARGVGNWLAKRCDNRAQFKFGDSLIGVENAVRMGKLDAGDLRAVLGTRYD